MGISCFLSWNGIFMLELGRAELQTNSLANSVITVLSNMFVVKHFPSKQNQGRGFFLFFLQYKNFSLV